MTLTKIVVLSLAVATAGILISKKNKKTEAQKVQHLMEKIHKQVY